MIVSFRNKDLEKLYETGKSRRIDSKMYSRILRRLDALDAATQPEDVNLPGFNFHGLSGFSPKRYTIHINGPWCITFEWNDGADNVDFEQYH